MRNALHILPLFLGLALNEAQAQNFSLAPMFGQHGTKSFSIALGEDHAIRHVLLPDGQLLLGGGGYYSGCNCNHISLVKLDTLCGKFDASFGTNGVVAQVFDGRSTLSDMAVANDGRILACGVVAPDNSGSLQVCGIYRFNANGTPDLTFDNDGWRGIRFDPVSSGAFHAVIPLADGRFFAVGNSSYNINGGSNGIGVMRFLQDGTLDNSWAGDGITWTAGNFRPSDAVMMPDSSVVWIGHNLAADYSVFFARFNPDGTGNGATTTVGTMNEGTHRLRARPLPDGRFLVSGFDANGNAFVARFLTDLTLDPTYGVDGVSTVTIPTPVATGGSIDLLADGSTVQFGSQQTGGSWFAIKRDADGLPVPTFGNAGIVTTPHATGDQFIRGGAMLSDTRLAGYGQDYLADPLMSVVKLTTEPQLGQFADLGPDTGFCPGQSVLLDAGYPGSSYQWFRSSFDLGTAQTITANVAGTYRVNITDAQGCTDRDTIVVAAYSAPNIPLIEQFGDELYTTAFPPLQWYLNGEPIPGATEDIWMAVENGTYTVEATDPFTGCTATSPPFNVLNVGLAEYAAATFTQAFPNPFTDHLFLRLRLPEAMTITVDLTDLQGRRLERLLQQRAMPAGEAVLELTPTNELARGNYLLEVSTAHGIRYVRVAH